MNAKTVITTAVVFLLASGWASAQAAKSPAPDTDKPSAAAEMPRTAATPAKAPAKAAGPKLNMDAPEKNPGKDQDKRNCLDLPTNAEIAKCAQKK